MIPDINRHDVPPVRGSLLLLVSGLLFLYSLAYAQPAPGWQHLKYAIYFTSHDVEHLLATPAQFATTMEYFAPVRARHVYLEGTGQGEINVPLYKELAGRFRALGMTVSGAMVPTGKQGPSTYNNAGDMAALERRMRALAQVFDDIILDDWLFTTAVDPKSVEERGSRSWADYRTKLIIEQSKKVIIGAAREVNPKVRITIKYPNWYESHRDNGYDVYHETRLYDQMAVGIETRQRMVHDQHIPIYSGYVFQKWWPGVEPQKWVGSWLDNYEMKGDSNDYVAQVWQAVLARTPEIILWCAGQLWPANPSSDVYAHLVRTLPEFDRIAGLLQGDARGVPIHLPYGTTGEYNIFGYLGMAGIPLAPAPAIPAAGKSAIFTLHSVSEGSLPCDTALAARLIDRLKNGQDVFMTCELWKRLRTSEIGNALMLVPGAEGSMSSNQIRIRTGWFSKTVITAEHPIAIPTVRSTTWPEARDVALVRDDFDYGLLFHVQYLRGDLYVLNLPDNSYDLLRLPAPALELVRRAFVGELGVELIGQGSVAMYLFGDRQYVLYNMGDIAAPVALRIPSEARTQGWKNLVTGKLIDAAKGHDGGVDVPLTLAPFEIAVVEMTR
jgi:hypothetical protein